MGRINLVLYCIFMLISVLRSSLAFVVKEVKQACVIGRREEHPFDVSIRSRGPLWDSL